MKTFAIIVMALGIMLMSVGVGLAQRPPGDPPDNPPPGDEDGRPGGRDGRGRRDRERPNLEENEADEQSGDQNEPEVAAGSPANVVPVTDAAPVIVQNVLLGGDNTVFDESVEAFTNHLPGLTDAQILQFEEGDELFEQPFIMAAGGVDALDDGLGPLFNADSCDSCHIEDGRGRPPEFPGETETGFLIRLARPELNMYGGTMPDPVYGGQLQDISVSGIAPEGTVLIDYTEVTGLFPDGTAYTLRVPAYTVSGLPYGMLADDVTFSPRVANQMIGLGLLEAIPDDTLLALADPNDADGDGISGRPNYVWDAFNNRMALGRFGWKANQPHLIQQTAGAYNGDMGISTSLYNAQPCMNTQADCMNMVHGGAPEISDDHLLLVVFYSSTLSVPAQRNADDPLVQRGEAIFMQAQCDSCHIPNLTTGIHPTIPQLSNQNIRPFTDLLLHDMGDGLADNQTDYQATGSEWRTPPLWGIGLFETVNGHTYYLHDGRARNLTEAILWHGGEAQASRDYFVNLSVADREALLAFLRSL